MKDNKTAFKFPLLSFLSMALVKITYNLNLGLFCKKCKCILNFIYLCEMQSYRERKRKTEGKLPFGSLLRCLKQVTQTRPKLGVRSCRFPTWLAGTGVSGPSVPGFPGAWSWNRSRTLGTWADTLILPRGMPSWNINLCTKMYIPRT